tara:strand:+ start:8735 stop:9274 length:540 start_codon:yes stop_codon:yes gene_type:complete
MIKSLVNGIWEHIPDQKLKIGEDTFGFNNGLYETFRTLSFRPIFLDEHIDRLVNSAKIIGLKKIYSKNQIHDMAVKVIKDLEKPDQLARIILVEGKLIIYTSALKLKYSLTAGSLFENKCSIEKSIFSLGIKDDNRMVTKITIAKLFFGLLINLEKNFSNIKKFYFKKGLFLIIKIAQK